MRQLDLFKDYKQNNSDGSPCDDKFAPDCESACCYIPSKEITNEDSRRLDPENVVRLGEGIFIKDNPVTGACPYLDGGCTIYDKRPQVCRDYSCSVDGKIKGMVGRVKTQDLKLRRRVIDDLMETAKRSSDPDAFIELMTL